MTRSQLQLQAYTRQPPTLSNGVTLAKRGLGSDTIIQELGLSAYFFPTWPQNEDGSFQSPDGPVTVASENERLTGWFTCLAFILSATDPDAVCALHGLKRECLREPNPAAAFHQCAVEECHFLDENDLVLVMEYVTGVELSAAAASVEPHEKEVEGGRAGKKPRPRGAPRPTPRPGRSSS